MAGDLIRPADLVTERTSPVASEFMVVDNGVTVAKAKISDIGNTARPFSNQAEAEAGASTTKTMTPLATKQAVTARIDVDIASKAQGDKADTAVQPEDIGTAAAEDIGFFATAAQGTKADSAVQPARTITAGTGLTGGGDLSADRSVALSTGSQASLALADSAVQPARAISAGTGLTGGGSLAADRTLGLSAGSQASLALADSAVQQVPIFATQDGVAALTLQSYSAIRTNGAADARDGRAAIMAFSATEPNHYGKVQSADGQWWEEVSRAVSHDVFRSNTTWLPAVNAEIVGGPTASPGGTTNYFNVFFAPGGSPLASLSNTIYRSTAVGHAIGQSAYSWERVEAFGNRAMGFAEMGNRVVAIGSLALQWLGSRTQQHLVDTFHDWWLASNNGPPGSVGWDFQGMETRNPGIGATIQAFSAYPTTRDDVSGIIAVGRDSGLHMVKGGSSVFIGYQAGTNAFSVDSLTAIGDRALRDGVFLTQSVGVGGAAGAQWQTGTRNTAIGYSAASNTVRGDNNTVVGALAGLLVTDMAGSVLLGYQAGQGIGTNLSSVLAIQVGSARLPLLAGRFTDFVAGVNINPANIKGTFHIRSADSGVATVSGNGDELILENSTHGGMTIMTPNTVNGYIYFADPESPSSGFMYYNHADNTMRIGRNGAVGLAISPTGMGFNGTAAVTKPTLAAAATDAATTQTLVNDIRAKFIAYGLAA